jgi:hypothetical protein
MTGNPLFGMIHPRQLEELTQRYYPGCAIHFFSRESSANAIH